MTMFYFVRHGVTSHTGHKLSGWMPDIHLSEEGEAQAEAAAQMLARVPLKAVYSSPIERTFETARFVAAPHGLTVRTRRNLGEVEYGKWTNRSFKTLVGTRLWRTVQRFPSAARFPDGESLREVQMRAVGEIEKLRTKHRKQAICCVSHADVIRLVCAHYLGVHIDLFQRLIIGPASVSVISVDDDGPRVITLNSSPPEARSK
ncbi:MAG: MSMEG_4193 family putative phosphomutase [Actinobacteria bacterium]|nr:MSMEG_4193 family putative phosphomutase [Actinomycetota bacterium]